MKKTSFIPFLLCIACWALLPINLNAQVVTKETDDGSDGTLRQEILDTPAGGTITFATDIHTISINSEIVIDKSLIIQGDSTATVMIDAQDKSRIFNISADSVSLTHLTLFDGGFPSQENDGAGIYLKDTHLKLIDVNIKDCGANHGGGVYCSGASNLEVTGGTFSNGGIKGGSFYNDMGTIHLINVLLDKNGSDGDGCALYNNGGEVSISGSTISNSTSYSGFGAGIYNLEGKVSIVNSTLSGNGSTEYGGAIYSEAGELEITDSNIINNSSRHKGGAGLYLLSNDLVTLNNVNLSGNVVPGPDYPNNGAGLYATGIGDIVINGGVIENNVASLVGGGIYFEGTTLTINGTIIKGNRLDLYASLPSGSIYSDGATINLNGAEIAENRSDAFSFVLGGAGIGGGSSNSTIILNAGTQVLGNIAESSFGDALYGGGILMEAGTLIVNGTAENPVIFEGNFAGSGGAILSSSSQPALLNNVKFLLNRASYGAAIHFSGTGTLTIMGGSADGNGTGKTSSLEGGAFWNGTGTMTIDGTELNGNSAGRGGALFNNGGTLNVKNAQLMNNGSDKTGSSGGGIYNTVGGSLTVTYTDISHNGAASAGGGIADNSTETQGTVTLTDVILKDNKANGTTGVGGGLSMIGNGKAVITSCEISGNYADNQAGALWNDAADIQILTSTISGNRTGGLELDETNNGNGGGIYNNAGSIHIDASTLVLNQSQGAGGAVFNGSSSATTTLRNSMIALNTAVNGKDLGGANNFVSADYNLIGQDDMDVFQAMSNDLEGTAASPMDPLIDALADNGGFTRTHSLLEKSPAYNAGNPVDDFPDQRGEAVFGGRRDIGALEAQTSLGIGDSPSVALSESLLYPNPSNGSIEKLDIPYSVTSDIDIQVIEIGIGKVVLNQEGRTGSNELNIGSLATGAYLVRMVTGDTVESLKMIVGK